MCESVSLQITELTAFMILSNPPTIFTCLYGGKTSSVNEMYASPRFPFMRLYDKSKLSNRNRTNESYQISLRFLTRAPPSLSSINPPSHYFYINPTSYSSFAARACEVLGRPASDLSSRPRISSTLGES